MRLGALVCSTFAALSVAACGSPSSPGGGAAVEAHSEPATASPSIATTTAPASPSTEGPALTCGAFQGVRATYRLMSGNNDDGFGTDYWPEVTLVNGSHVPIRAVVIGQWSATTDVLNGVARANWDRPWPSIAPGESETVDFRSDMAEVLAVGEFERITEQTMRFSRQRSRSVFGSDASVLVAAEAEM